MAAEHPPTASTGASFLAANRRRIWLALVLVPLYELILVSRGGTALFQEVSLGHVFNAMALNLLELRFDIDPAVIENEAFFRDGRTYTYFGIFPALLRLPLVPFLDIATLPLSRLSLWLALTVGSLAQLAAATCAFRNAPQGPARDAIESRLLLAAALSGPPILLAFAGTLFDEAGSWGWALAACYCAVALHGLTRPAGFTTGLLCAMAALAGCCMLARTTVGVGVALSLVLLCLVLAARVDGLRGVWRQALTRRFLAPALILAAFAAVLAAINQARWGTPFSIGDVRLQLLMIAEYPDRLWRIDHYGHFNIRRLGYTLLYYFFPIWAVPVQGGLLFEGRIRELFDLFEMPPTSFLITEPLTMLLAGMGAWALLRGRFAGAARGPAAALVTGLCFAPALMLTAWFVAYRYRLDFAPLFFTLACLGGMNWALRARDFPAARIGRMGTVFSVLFLLQFLGSHVTALIYGVTILGPAHDYLAQGYGAYVRLILRYISGSL